MYQSQEENEQYFGGITAFETMQYRTFGQVSYALYRRLSQTLTLYYLQPTITAFVYACVCIHSAISMLVFYLVFQSAGSYDEMQEVQSSGYKTDRGVTRKSKVTVQWERFTILLPCQFYHTYNNC